MTRGARYEAAQNGQQTYTTGKPCKRGHDAARLTSNGSCTACWQIKYKRDRSQIIERATIWNKNNKVKRSARLSAPRQEPTPESLAARYKAKREAARIAASETRASNPDLAAKIWKRHYEKHRSKLISYYSSKGSQRRGAEGAFTAADIDAIRILQNGKCAYCRVLLSKVREHRDHITSIAAGGTNRRSNLQLLCEPCNLRKGAVDPIVFAQSLGMLL